MIGGNTKALLQAKVSTPGELGTKKQEWHDVIELTGWLDLSSGEAKSTTFNAKIQESTHIFLGDYKPIPDTLSINGKDVRVSAENARIVINSKRYDVLLIDNPMETNRQLEIYLKFTGGQ